MESVEPVVLLARDPSRTDIVVDSLPLEVQVLVASAGRGSIVHLRGLTSLLRADPRYRLAHYPLVLDTLLHLFDDPPPLRRVSTRDKSRVEAIGVALVCLHLVTMSHLATKVVHIEGSLFVVKVLPFWPKLWEWMRNIFYWADGGMDMTFNAESRPSTKAWILNMVSIQCIITESIPMSSANHWNTSLSRAILATPGVFLMLAEIWTRQPDRPWEEAVFFHTSFLDGSLTELINADVADIRALDDAVHNDQQRLTTSLLKPLQMAAYGGESWIRGYYSVLIVYDRLALRAPRLGAMLLSQTDTLLCIFQPFRMFTSMPMPSESDHRYNEIMLCIGSIYQIISRAFATTDSARWLLKAVSYGLIPCVLRSTLWLPSKMVDMHIVILRILASQTIFRPLLKSFGKALESKAVKDVERMIPQHGKFWEAWLMFTQQVNGMLVLKASFDRAEIGKVIRKCSAPECYMIEAAGGLRSCSACKVAVYCSASCQKQDWQGGNHRPICKFICESSGNLRLLDARDIAFFALWSEEALVQQCHKIMYLRDQALIKRASPTRPLGLLFDFVTCPPSTSIIPGPPWQLPSPVESKQPLLQPCFNIQYGRSTRRLSIPSTTSGTLFGWLHDPDNGKHPEERSVDDHPENVREIEITKYVAEIMALGLYKPAFHGIAGNEGHRR
ncbi:hypothetical protein Hypma_004680 [Hypsizygus marmoreus]|uniref:MYND-type domain-containing protein n=1 Tax=Hypsizygus marmoreus TaxID=39966 RepID=A0A369J2G9_HYPMA|nr:hypothetical protein Hypma_004680 [Hypsizygus marmoreus]